MEKRAHWDSTPIGVFPKNVIDVPVDELNAFAKVGDEGPQHTMKVQIECSILSAVPTWASCETGIDDATAKKAGGETYGPEVLTVDDTGRRVVEDDARHGREVVGIPEKLASVLKVILVWWHLSLIMWTSSLLLEAGESPCAVSCRSRRQDRRLIGEFRKRTN